VEDIVAIVMVFGTGMLGVIAFSPIGKAIAERLRGRRLDGPSGEDLDEIRDHLQSLQQQVGELAERQDFAERLLAQAREKGVLGPGSADAAR
jgi:hypothetical protein